MKLKTKIRIGKTTLLALILGAGLVGCDDLNREIQAGKIKSDAIIKRCIDAGGIPATSVWDGRLTNCIFPPKTAD